MENNYANMDSFAVKRFLIGGAVQEEGRVYPNREWGYGKLDIYEVFNNLRNL